MVAVNTKKNIFLERNHLIKSKIENKHDNDIYCKLEMSTQSQFYGVDVDPSQKFSALKFDFYNYESQKYLYTIDFQTNWIGELKLIGPVNEHAFNIFYDYNIFVDNLNFSEDGSPNSHFYLKGDDPNINDFLEDFFTKSELEIYNDAGAVTLRENRFFYFICSDVYDQFVYWYIVYSPNLPLIYDKNEAVDSIRNEDS